MRVQDETNFVRRSLYSLLITTLKSSDSAHRETSANIQVGQPSMETGSEMILNLAEANIPSIP